MQPRSRRRQGRGCAERRTRDDPSQRCPRQQSALRNRHRRPQRPHRSGRLLRAVVADDEDCGIVSVSRQVGHFDDGGGQHVGIGVETRAHQLGHLGQTGLHRVVRALHHSVGEQHEHPGLCQTPVGHRIPLTRHDAERRPAAVECDAMTASGCGPDHRDMAGPGDRQIATDRVEAQETARCEEATPHGDQQIVGAAQYLSGVARRLCEGAQAGTHLPHEGDGFHVMTLHIADRETQ